MGASLGGQALGDDVHRSTGDRGRLSRRAALQRLAMAGAGMTLAIGGATSWRWSGRPALAQTTEPTLERFPALGLQIATPPAGSVPEINLRSAFGAVGDGSHDDSQAFLALAQAVNAGQVASGSVIRIPAGQYRVIGDTTFTFRRPVVLRGDGPASTVIRLEYATQGSTFLRAQGQGMYSFHTAGVYSFPVTPNAYPNAPFASVQGIPRAGDTVLTVDQPGLFQPGDHVYLLCDDYGAAVVYAPTTQRFDSFLLKQYLQVKEVVGSQVRLDVPLRHDFAGSAPRLYRWQPISGLGIEHLAIDDHNTIADSEALTTFRAVDLDGVVDGWVWDVHFLNNTSIPLRVGRSRRVVVSESLFDLARHVGAGGNGYLPEMYLADDSLVEYCTSIDGRHALICNWSCWGNVFRYNRLTGTPNAEVHGEYSVENLYLRNDARGSLMDTSGGGTIHGHDGPNNEFRQNYAQGLRVLKEKTQSTRFIQNWQLQPILDTGTGTVQDGNQIVPPGWNDFPYAAFCGHDHSQTAENARPVPGKVKVTVSRQPGAAQLVATLTARPNCGAIDHIQFGVSGRPFGNARVSVTSPAGGPTGQTSGFSYTPPARTTTVTLAVERIAQSGGATVSPISFYDRCGEWRTFVGGGADAFR